ncbi:hypothetical protein SAMN05444285_101245 [Draconibacterium orientale]|uniref:Uncharacterized protein n=1 Tax=Draconibacterium orientale TaxID=1168034 RepID=A0A1H9YMA8_9BACT|nr:hypothetical protein SAMN05444285_101245 [Draconibacterium orientale]
MIREGEYHFNFTSNHNTNASLFIKLIGEYHFNFTSNHNWMVKV